MLQPRISASLCTPTTIRYCFSALAGAVISISPYRCSIRGLQLRYASHASQGTANRASRGPGKRLGAKRGDSEVVVPNTIIFRQRGTHWFPGENCGMGRDHTIHSLVKGYVRYYRDPERHKDRKYIGVVIERGQALPTPRNAPRKRRLGMVAVEAKSRHPQGVAVVTEQLGQEVPEVKAQRPKRGTRDWRAPLTLREGYQYRESNRSIGRTAENRGVRLSPHRPNDRFKAWRKKVARGLRNAKLRSVKESGKKGRSKK